MNPFLNLPLRQLAHLTKAGKLAEAMQILQGERADNQANGLPSFPWISSQASDATDTVEAPSPAKHSHPAFLGEMLLRELSAAKPTGVLPGLSSLRHWSETKPGNQSRTAAFRSPSAPLSEGARFEERTLSNAAGNHTYKLYVPSGYKGQRLPVVVMLHGCTQDPDDFAAGTRMNEVAEEHSFFVAYPRQPKSANPQKCWNWFNAGDQRRDGAEPSFIAGVALEVVEEFSADPARVYVAGLSAGGAAAAIMGATHPDVFAAVGVHSGLACGAARDMPSAFAAMGGGGAVRPRGNMAAVPTIVFHGDADRTVNSVNGDHVVAQAAPAGSLTPVVSQDKSAGGVGYTRTVHLDSNGRETLEQWVLHGAGHAWSGGSPAGSYVDPRGPDASRAMVRFFLAHRRGDA